MLSFCKIAERVAPAMALNSAAMLDWNDLRYFLAVAREGSTLAAGAIAHQPDDRRPPHRRARKRARLPPLRKAPGRLCTHSRGRRLVERAEQVERAATAFRTPPPPTAATSAARSRSPPRKSTASPCWRHCCASCTNSIPKSSSSSTRRRWCATSARAKQTFRCAAPRRGDLRPRALSAASCASTIGRSIAAGTTPRGTASPRTARRSKHAFIGGGGGNLWSDYQAWLQ